MGKTTKGVLIGVTVLVALWVLVHIPAYVERRKNCTSRLHVETCNEAYVRCVERGYGAGSEQCEGIRRGCDDCLGKAWRAFLSGGQVDWPW
jgi:hypothetical protein